MQMKMIVGVAGLVLAGLLPAVSLALLPGMPMPNRPDLPVARGRVSESTLGRNGALYLHGDFTSVSGVRSPGFAKLNATGLPDYFYRPESLLLSGAVQLPDALPFPFSPSQQVSRFLALSNGLLLHAKGATLLAYNSWGRLDKRFSHLNESEIPFADMFEQDEMLYILRSVGVTRVIEAVDIHSGVATTVQTAGWPAPCVNAIPAENGRLWVLGLNMHFSLYLWSSPTYWLFRVDSAGALDATFSPVELAGDRTYSLKEGAAGGYLLVHQNASRWMYWSSPTSIRYGVDSYNSSGVKTASRSVTHPRGMGLLVAEESDSNLLHNVSTRSFLPDQLVRVFPTGERDAAFALPLAQRSLHLLPDGKIHYSHVLRSLKSGADDPGWHVPDLRTDPRIEIIGRFHGGDVLVRETGTPLDGQSCLMVVGTDLSMDRAFEPPHDLPLIQTAQMSVDQESVFLTLAGLYELPDGRKTRVVRLLRNGEMAPDSPVCAPPSGVMFFMPAMATISEVPFAGSFSLFPLSGNAFLVYYVQDHGDVAVARVARYLTDGSPDPAFTNNIGMYDSVIWAMSDGRFLTSKSLYETNGTKILDLPSLPQAKPKAEMPDGSVVFLCYSNSTPQLVKWHPETCLDPGFKASFPEGSVVGRVVVERDGRLIVAGSFPFAGQSKQLCRLYANGHVDFSFTAPEARRVLPWCLMLRSVVRDGVSYPATFKNRIVEEGISSMLYIPESEAVMIGGSFTHVGWRPRAGLAMLSSGRLRTFPAWLAALGQSDLPLEESGEELLFHAYVSGKKQGDNVQHISCSVKNEIGPIIEFPLNPDAEDVDAVIELSSDLMSWRPLRDDEVYAATTNGTVVRLHIDNATSPMFIRIRYLKGM